MTSRTPTPITNTGIKTMNANHIKTLLLALTLGGLLSGCAVQVASSVTGAAVGAATGAAIGVAKVPFQVGGAVVDVVSGE